MKTALIRSLLGLGLLAGAGGCEKEETYPALPRELYLASVVPAGATTFTNSAAGLETVRVASARVYLNQLMPTDVQVTYAVAGTATGGSDYELPTSTTLTIPAGERFGQINLNVVDDRTKESTETILIRLESATQDFQLGLGHPASYNVFTYSIRDND